MALYLESEPVSAWHRSLGNGTKVAHQFYNVVEGFCMSLAGAANNFIITSNITAGHWKKVVLKSHVWAEKCVAQFIETVEDAALTGASLSIDPSIYRETPNHKPKDPTVPLRCIRDLPFSL